MAATGQIGFWTVVLLCGQVLPYVAAPLSLFFPFATFHTDETVRLSVCAYICCNFARCAAGRDQTLVSIALHPVAIVLLLAIQWYAVFRAVIGKPIAEGARAVKVVGRGPTNSHVQIFCGWLVPPAP